MEILSRNLYCSNYAQCNSFYPDQGGNETTEQRARARGWHIFHGVTIGGKAHNEALCEKCATNSHYRPPAKPLEGQDELFSGTQES